MRMLEKISNRTVLDVKSPASLFIGFLLSLCLLALIARSLDFETVIFGETLTKHVSDIMSEHEAGKSMFALSILVLLISYTKLIMEWLSIPIKPSINTYIFINPANFLISLISVELAVTTAVLIMVPKGPINYWDPLLYLGGKNYFLGGTLIISLIFLHTKPTLNMNKLAKSSVAIITSASHFWALTL